ncbi:hypothetical protein C8F04DRAFT_1182049 [Mycena alexandri]|uniref:Uncharacterized protein n=1 Tax=Mycena alexandri TaxID=1745969 RepID=A0AAD6X1V1_9AGAR|nr:hypothetical protein C8F04DRAFT_1182049 [Mycena alexandri]
MATLNLSLDFPFMSSIIKTQDLAMKKDRCTVIQCNTVPCRPPQHFIFRGRRNGYRVMFIPHALAEKAETQFGLIAQQITLKKQKCYHVCNTTQCLTAPRLSTKQAQNQAPSTPLGPISRQALTRASHLFRLVTVGPRKDDDIHWESKATGWHRAIMRTTPAFRFRTAFFWRDYPHTHLGGAMKRYYVVQIGYWVQQWTCVDGPYPASTRCPRGTWTDRTCLGTSAWRWLLRRASPFPPRTPMLTMVLLLGLEKRRSDYWEYMVHHFVTVWMVSERVGCVSYPPPGSPIPLFLLPYRYLRIPKLIVFDPPSWSYLMNVTLLGTAVFVSMDVPDLLLAPSRDTAIALRAMPPARIRLGGPRAWCGPVWCGGFRGAARFSRGY